MLINERHQQILELIKARKFVSTRVIIAQLHISEATARRDLTFMEKNGLIKRTHGGAMLTESPTSESSIIVRKEYLVKEKRMIASKCLDYIKDGHSYFFDSSSTVSHLIGFLSNYDELLVITNGINNAMLLSAKNIKTYLTAGFVSITTNSTLGTDGIDLIDSFNCDAFLFSCSGLSLNGGITEANVDQQRIKSRMIKNSAIHILLVDHTKFDKIYVSKTCNFSEIDIVITDKKPPAQYIEAFEKYRIQLIIAE